MQEGFAREDGGDAGGDAVLRGPHEGPRAGRHGHHGGRGRQGSEPGPRLAGIMYDSGTLQNQLQGGPSPPIVGLG